MTGVGIGKFQKRNVLEQVGVNFTVSHCHVWRVPVVEFDELDFQSLRFGFLSGNFGSLV
ncbi:hypothetical protein D3C80_1844780 [compost metagenome]